jgi:hypothetical protein
MPQLDAAEIDACCFSLNALGHGNPGPRTAEHLATAVISSAMTPYCRTQGVDQQALYDKVLQMGDAGVLPIYVEAARRQADDS